MTTRSLIDRIAAREAVVGIIGLGYVGFPVAVSFAEAGFAVIGVDVNDEKIRNLENGRSYVRDIPQERLQALRDRLTFSADYAALEGCDAVLISVPTPLLDGAPDLSMVVAAGEGVTSVLRAGMLVVLESTTYPGCTEDLLRPLLERDGLSATQDFLLAYSPERIDPGNPVFAFSDIPKVVGGLNEAATSAATKLYEQVVPKVIAVSGTREAEMTKLLENTFRHVNIALVNELAVYAHELGIDIWEVIEAAATKPFGYMPFWPGPGWGGHCIPLDPAYLSYRVRQHRAHDVRFVELAHAVNSEMPRYVVERISLLLNDQERSINGSRILGIGVGYKGGTEDTRESPGVKVLDTLQRRGARIAYHDPLVPSLKVGGRIYESLPLTKSELRTFHLVVILIPQAGVAWEVIRSSAPMVLDCCNVLATKGNNVTRL